MESVKEPWRKLPNKVTCGRGGRGFGNDTKTYSSTFYVGANKVLTNRAIYIDMQNAIRL